MSKILIRDRNKNNPDKKSNWEYRFEAAKIEGKRKHISKAGFRTKKEALEAGTQALAEYNNAGSYFKPSEISVSDYLDYWIKEVCTLNFKHGTQMAYRCTVTRCLKPHLGRYQLKAITPAAIQEFFNRISLSHNYAQGSISNIFRTLNSALNYAVYPLAYIKENPAKYVKLPRTGKVKERIVLSQEEFNDIITRFPSGSRFHIPLLIGWHCGLRISETCGLTWDDVNFEKKTLTVNKQTVKRQSPESIWFFDKPKYNSSRVIKIGDTLINELIKEKELQERNEKGYGNYYTVQVAKKTTDETGNVAVNIVSIKKPLFDSSLPCVKMICVNERGKYTSSAIMSQVKKIIVKELGIDFTYHTLRHTHATILIENGVSPRAVQQRLGHKNIATTLQVYVHDTEAMQDDAVSKFEQAIKKDEP